MIPPEERSPSDIVLAELFRSDAPIPVRHFVGVYGGLTTWHKWRSQGLQVLHVRGLGVCVRPSVLTAFLATQHEQEEASA